MEVLNILPIRLRRTLYELLDEHVIEYVQEINLRINKPVIVRYFDVAGRKELISEYILKENDLKETLGYISNFSMYAYEDEVREGFLTIKGGHRIGITGKVVMSDERIKTIKNISSLNIRVARQIKGCAEDIMKGVMREAFENTLIISPPCIGKTTLLREMVRLLSDRFNYKVGVVDERGEIAACHMGIPQNDIGIRTDVIEGCHKDRGIMMLIRSMSPDIIAVDELGTDEDVKSMYMAGGYGGKVIATIHGMGVDSLVNKEFMEMVVKNRFFKKYIVLRTDRTAKIYDEDGKCDGKVYRFYSGDNRNYVNRV